MIKKIRIIAGALLMYSSHNLVKNVLADYNFAAERTIEVSHLAYIPMIIGAILIFPLAYYKDDDKNIDLFRMIVGIPSLLWIVTQFIRLISSALSYIAPYDISLYDFYFGNAYFPGEVFLLITKLLLVLIILYPLLVRIIVENEPITSIFQYEKKESQNQKDFHMKDTMKNTFSNLKKEMDSKRQQFQEPIGTNTSNSNNSEESEDKFDKLTKYKKLLDEEIITEEEFQKIKEKLLDL